MAAGAGLGVVHTWAEGQSDGLWQTIREGAAQSAGSTHEVPANPSVAVSTEQQTRPVGQSSGPSQVMAPSAQLAVQRATLDIMAVVGQQGVVEALQTAMPQRISPAAGVAPPVPPPPVPVMPPEPGPPPLPLAPPAPLHRPVRPFRRSGCYTTNLPGRLEDRCSSCSPRAGVSDLRSRSCRHTRTETVPLERRRHPVRPYRRSGWYTPNFPRRIEDRCSSCSPRAGVSDLRSRSCRRTRMSVVDSNRHARRRAMEGASASVSFVGDDNYCASSPGPESGRIAQHDAGYACPADSRCNVGSNRRDGPTGSSRAGPRRGAGSARRSPRLAEGRTARATC
jgi:hypothetical protein